MSWWVSLNEGDSDGEVLLVQNHQHGGTVMVGGSEEAALNVTYNYGQHFREHLDNDGIEWLHGKSGEATLEWLERAISTLNADVHDDYWKPTEGNARRALTVLATWAKQHPQGVWRVN